MAKIKCLIILLLCTLNSFCQKLFEERGVNNIDGKLDSILIAGAGPSVSRIFLEDVSRYIIEGLNKSNVVAQYNYVGKNNDDAKKVLDTITKPGYKAVLLFLPKGTSLYGVQNYKAQNTSDTEAGPIRTTTYSTGVFYLQDFDLQLCMIKENMKAVWSASISVGGDPKKTKNAKKVAKKIIASFKANQYINQ